MNKVVKIKTQKFSGIKNVSQKCQLCMLSKWLQYVSHDQKCVDLNAAQVCMCGVLCELFKGIYSKLLHSTHMYIWICCKLQSKCRKDLCYGCGI